MKKIITLFMSLCLCFALTACKSSKDNEAILTFFNAFHETLQADSGHLKGTIDIEAGNDSTIEFDLQIIQTGNLQLALIVDLESGGNRQEDYLCFYIRDGKTYLKNLDTTSQSELANLGIDKTKKISVYDPFLNFTDDQLIALVKSSSNDGDEYHFDIDASGISPLIDAYETLDVKSSTLDTIIQDNVLKSFTFTLEGEQTINDTLTDVSISITCQIEDFNSLSSVSFPEDLASY